MTKYVTPVSKLHWMWAFEADRCEVNSNYWPDVREWIHLDNKIFKPSLAERWWEGSLKQPTKLFLRIRVEDDSSDG